MTGYLRELCGAGWTPSEVLVPHAHRGSDRPYRALLRVGPRFNADVCGIRFASRWLDQPNASHEPDARVVRAEPATPEAPDVVQQVCRALRRLLLDGEASGDAVASAMCMNRRTLNRRLRSRGLTYQKVLDELRFGVARQLLATSEMGLDDLAANLGYSSTSPFARTFSRWAGTAPGRWRRARITHGGLGLATDVP
jgi:AraC-like DNA-binding protein